MMQLKILRAHGKDVQKSKLHRFHLDLVTFPLCMWCDLYTVDSLSQVSQAEYRSVLCCKTSCTKREMLHTICALYTQTEMQNEVNTHEEMAIWNLKRLEWLHCQAFRSRISPSRFFDIIFASCVALHGQCLFQRHSTTKSCGAHVPAALGHAALGTSHPSLSWEKCWKLRSPGKTN